MREIKHIHVLVTLSNNHCIQFCRPDEDVSDVKVGEGEDCLNKVAPEGNVELYVHVVPDLYHRGCQCDKKFYLFGRVAHKQLI